MKNDAAVLDTTYVLPLFGILIDKKTIRAEDIAHLWRDGTERFSLVLPTPCLLEVVYKLNRLYRKEAKPEILVRYTAVLPSVITNEHVSIFDPYQDIQASRLAFNLREKGHTDLNDCFIAGVAMKLGGILVTEDEALSKAVRPFTTTNRLEVLDWEAFFGKILYHDSK